jgi:hypothetical protein
MKRSLIILSMIICIAVFTGCNKSGCDECLNQKEQFCTALSTVNCNSVYLTDNIDQLTRACGKDEATSFISTTTHNCNQGTLTCPQCE